MKRSFQRYVAKNLKKVQIWVETPKKTRKKIAKETQFFDKNTRACQIPTYCLINLSSALNSSKQKKHLDNRYYVQHHYTTKIVFFDGVVEEFLLKFYHLIRRKPTIGMSAWNGLRRPARDRIVNFVPRKTKNLKVLFQSKVVLMQFC